MNQPPLLWRVCVTACALAGFFALTYVSRADYSITGRFGFDTNDQQNGGCLKVVNYTESPATIQVCNTAGSPVSSVGLALTKLRKFVGGDPPYQDFSGTWSVQTACSNAATTVPAGSVRYITFNPSFRVLSSSNMGVGDIVWKHYFLINGVQELREYSALPVLWIAHGSTIETVATAPHLIGAGNSIYSGNSVSTTSTSSTWAWGTVNIGSPAGVGRIVVSGLQGAYRASLKIDGVERASGSQNAPLGTAGPDIEWTTSTPEDWIGAHVQLWVNDLLMPERTAPYDYILISANDASELGPSNFEYILQPYSGTITDDGWIYDQLYFDPEGEMEIPSPESDLDLPERPADENHQNREPPPPPATVDGATDPASDNTVDSDGAGAGTGLSVKDQYRAVRQALEDVLNDGNDGRFNFGEWEKGAEFEDTGAGPGIASGFTGAVGTSMGFAAVAPMTMDIPGLGGAPALSVALLGNDIMVPSPPFAAWVRNFMLLFLYIIFAVAMYKMLRSALAGR